MNIQNPQRTYSAKGESVPTVSQFNSGQSTNGVLDCGSGSEAEDWEPCPTGMYCLIHYIETYDTMVVSKIAKLRLDLIDKNNIPVRSYIGCAAAIRKRVTREFPNLSAEHASYIGSELVRAQFEGLNYKQG